MDILAVQKALDRVDTLKQQFVALRTRKESATQALELLGDVGDVEILEKRVSEQCEELLKLIKQMELLLNSTEEK